LLGGRIEIGREGRRGTPGSVCPGHGDLISPAIAARIGHTEYYPFPILHGLYNVRLSTRMRTYAIWVYLLAHPWYNELLNSYYVYTCVLDILVITRIPWRLE
jgi:hypothetical protein